MAGPFGGDLVGRVDFPLPEEASAAHVFTALSGEPALPFAQGLVDAAQEAFGESFVTASWHAPAVLGTPSGARSRRLAQDQGSRLDRMESVLDSVQEAIAKLSSSMTSQGDVATSSASLAATAKPKARGHAGGIGLSGASPPGLAQQAFASASASGMTPAQLSQVRSLISARSGTAMPDVPQARVHGTGLDVLSESGEEEADEPLAAGEGEAGSMELAVTQLTKIVKSLSRNQKREPRPGRDRFRCWVSRRLLRELGSSIEGCSSSSLAEGCSAATVKRDQQHPCCNGRRPTCDGSFSLSGRYGEGLVRASLKGPVLSKHYKDRVGCRQSCRPSTGGQTGGQAAGSVVQSPVAPFGHRPGCYRQRVVVASPRGSAGPDHGSVQLFQSPEPRGCPGDSSLPPPREPMDRASRFQAQGPRRPTGTYNFFALHKGFQLKTQMLFRYHLPSSSFVDFMPYGVVITAAIPAVSWQNLWLHRRLDLSQVHCRYGKLTAQFLHFRLHVCISLYMDHGTSSIR